MKKKVTVKPPIKWEKKEIDIIENPGIKDKVGNFETYPWDFQVKVIVRYADNHMNQQLTCKEAGIHHETLDIWFETFGKAVLAHYHSRGTIEGMPDREQCRKKIKKPRKSVTILSNLDVHDFDGTIEHGVMTSLRRVIALADCTDSLKDASSAFNVMFTAMHKRLEARKVKDKPRKGKEAEVVEEEGSEEGIEKLLQNFLRNPASMLGGDFKKIEA